MREAPLKFHSQGGSFFQPCFVALTEMGQNRVSDMAVVTHVCNLAFRRWRRENQESKTCELAQQVKVFPTESDNLNSGHPGWKERPDSPKLSFHLHTRCATYMHKTIQQTYNKNVKVILCYRVSLKLDQGA